MGEIILHPCDKNYCEECIYSNRDNGACNNEKYFKNNAYDDYNFYDSRFCCLCRGKTGFRSGSVKNE